MFFNLFATAFGILIFIFIFWKKLKEDYSAEIIFTSALATILGIITFYFLAKKFMPPYWFWSGIFGALMGLGLSSYKFHLRFYEVFEAMVISVLPLTAFVFLTDSVASASIFSFIYFVIIVALIGLYYILDKRYKSFTWYRSGRIGFSGLGVTATFFLLRALFALFFPDVLSFVNKFEPIVSGIVTFVFFLLLFNLSRKVS